MNYLSTQPLPEQLLAAWLRLSCVLDNQRLLARQGRLPFNEAMVCGLLAQAQAQGRFLTASELCHQTRILKSQMNAILHSLERKGAVNRRRSLTDRRRRELELLPEGLALYQDSHRHVRAMAERVILDMGREQAEALIPLLRQAADIFDTILQEE